jgi:hypothetical protein
MSWWATVLILIAAIIIIEKDLRRPIWNWVRREVFLRKNDVDQLDDNVELPLPPAGKLDWDLYRLLSGPVTHGPWSGGHLDESLVAKQIRGMIQDEIAFRVHPSALNNDIGQASNSAGGRARERFEEEKEKWRAANQQRQALIAAVRAFAAEAGMSEAWLLKNGGFQPKPLTELRLPLGGFPASSYVQLFCGGRIKDARDYEMTSLLSHDLHRFGSELGYDSLDEVPSKELGLILQYKDRMLALFNNSH